MALKPVPRLILIVAVVAGLGFGISKFLPQGTSSTAAPVSQDNLPAPAPTSPSFAAVTTAPATATVSAQRGALERIAEKGVVRVAVQSPSKPFFYLDNGVSKGFNVEYLKLLFSQPQFTTGNKQIVLDTGHGVDTYPDVPKALLKKDSRGNATVDIAIDGLTFSDEDLPGVVYTSPYVKDFGYSLITAGHSTIKSANDLNGKTIGVLQGDPDVKAYVTGRYPGSRVVELSDASVDGERSWINRAIKTGAVDVVVYDYPFGVAEIEGTDLQFTVSKMPESDIQYKIGVRKEDTALLNALNVAIARVQETQEYSALIRKYFASKNLSQVRSAADGESVYMVKTGDTLSVIAGRVLGSTARYAELEARNNLPNPNLIQVGQKLVVPKV